MTAGLELVREGSDDDARPLVARGAAVFTRGDVQRRADALYEVLRHGGITRAYVRSDDPVDLLRAVDACTRARTDLWIVHTALADALVADIAQEFGIEYRIGKNDGNVAAAARNMAVGTPRIHMMTSGTTGRPKIAVHTLASLLGRAARTASAAGRDERWLLTYVPTGFAGMQVILTAAVSSGSSALVVVPEARTPAGFLAAATAHQVTHLSATPTFFRSFLMVLPKGALSPRQITLGAEATDQATLDRVRAAFPGARVSHVYASTEGGVAFAVHDGRAGFPREWLDTGTQGISLRIEDGLLQIRTPHAMRAYTTESAQPVRGDGWLETSDQAEIVGDRVHILGRRDSIINVGGSKVYPLAVESFLLRQPGVVEAKAYAVPNPVSGALVGADVVLAPRVDAAEARIAILTACRAELPRYEVPRVFRVVDSIDVGSSGKKG